MDKILPCLWFNDNAEEAANYYVSIFKNSRILDVTRYGETVPRTEGKVLTVEFELEGRKFIALNGGPLFRFNEAISFAAACKTQQEVDDLWSKLSAGGQEQPCGWLKDKFGVSWQIIPEALMDLLRDKDPARVRRVTNAMLQMKKLDIGKLLQSAEAK